MLPVSRSSPENSRLLGLLFSNYLNLHIKISNFLAKSDHFEHFLKNSIFENLFWPILYGKKLILRFSIFWMNQKILSIFWKILSLKISTSVLTHFIWEKLDFEKSFMTRIKMSNSRFLLNKMGLNTCKNF